MVRRGKKKQYESTPKKYIDLIDDIRDLTRRLERDRHSVSREEWESVNRVGRIAMAGLEKQKAKAKKREEKEKAKIKERMSYLTMDLVASHVSVDVSTLGLLLEKVGWLYRRGDGWLMTKNGLSVGGKVERVVHRGTATVEVLWPSDILFNPELERVVQESKVIERTILLFVGGDQRQAQMIKRAWDLKLIHWKQGETHKERIPDKAEAVLIWTRHIAGDLNKETTTKAKSQGIALRRAASMPTLSLFLSELGYKQIESEQKPKPPVDKPVADLEIHEGAHPIEIELVLPEGISLDDESSSLEDLLEQMQKHLNDMDEAAELFTEAHEGAKHTFEEMKLGLAMLDEEKRQIEREKEEISKAMSILKGLGGK